MPRATRKDLRVSETIKGLRVVTLLLAGAASSCGANSSDGENQQNQQSPPPFEPGCTKAPACGTCGTCAEQCYCVWQDIVACADYCSRLTNAGGASNPGGGSPGAGGFSPGGGA